MQEEIKMDSIRRMEQKALFDLLNYHKKTEKQKVKDVLNKAARRYVPPKDMIFWPTGLLANTLAEHYSMWENKEDVLTALTTYFDRWIAKGLPIYYIDDVLCGVALIDLYKITGKATYKNAANQMVNYIYELEAEEADKAGNIPYRPAQKNQHIYVDGIGMMCPFLCKYGTEFNDMRAIELAILQIENMIKLGMDEKTGLPYHGFQYENKTKYGIIGWGRAVGWLLAGIADTLKFLPSDHKGQTSLTNTFEKLVHTVCCYQKENGAFAWQLEAMEGPEDSSATAMIAKAVLSGMECGVFCKEGKDANIKKLVEKAAEYLWKCEQDGRIYNCSGECMGFSQYPQVYDAYPWSLGPGLSVLLKEMIWRM